MSAVADTSPEAARVLADIFRAMSPARKWGLLADAQRTARRLHAAGVRRERPDVTVAELHRGWLARTLALPPQFVQTAEVAMDPGTETLDVVGEVARVFEDLGIAYALGGSLASSIHGTPRYTLDADMTAEPFADRVGAFVRSFGSEYYVSEPAIRQAIRDRASFNLIQTHVGFKVDVFIVKDRPFDRSALARRRLFALRPEPARPIAVVSPEDILLLKLEWYRLGAESSDRQWSDILGVLAARHGELDVAYLEHWARELGVADLLARARGTATGPTEPRT